MMQFLRQLAIEDATKGLYDATADSYITGGRLITTAVPRILLSSATNISATGAITGLTALPYVPGGVVPVFCYAQAGLLAGLYYAIFSSTTACQLYEQVSSDPLVPGSTLPSGITAGAYVGGTTEATMLSVVLPGGLLGPNGRLRAWGRHAGTVNAGVKSSVFRLGGSVLGIFTAVTSYGSVQSMVEVSNRGATNRQLYGTSALNASFSNTGTSLAWQQISIDTAVDQPITITCTNAAAADWQILESCLIEVLL